MSHEQYSLHREGWRYARYEARVLAAGRFLAWLRRHRIGLALTGVAVLALLLGFLGVIGTFTEPVRCENFVYGDVPFCSAKAFLSQVRYQYAPAEGEAVWSDSAPTAPGAYRVRAVSKNGFGMPRYSEATTVSVGKRELTITVGTASYYYGDNPMDALWANTEARGLAPGDELLDVEYTILEQTASADTFRIVNPAGQDVTDCYTETILPGKLTMARRPITVSVESAQKTYDAAPWDEAVAAVTEGTLAGQDQLMAVFSPAPAEVGQHSLTPVCAVLSPDGTDVTANYQITVNSGTLTVTPITIHIRTGSAEKQYDETPLSCAEWQLTEGTLLSGHKLVGQAAASQTVVGTSENRITMTAEGADGNDVTQCYRFVMEYGTLTVQPVVLRFETDSAERVYDGFTLVASGRRLVEGKLLKGHTLSMQTTGGQVSVGSSPNTLHVEITDSRGRDVTAEGYQILVDHGTLTVTPRPITLTSGSAEKLYDGYPLTCEVYEITRGTLEFGSRDQWVRRTYFTGSQTQVGSSANTFTVVITDAQGNVTTSNYDITYIYGTLTVLENPNPPQQGQQGGQQGQQGSTGIGKHGEDTTIGYPGAGSEKLYAQVRGISGFDNGAVTLYFRDGSYGDYTGTGWKAPSLYTQSFHSPLKYIGMSGGNLDVNETPSGVEINLMNGCTPLLPYYTSIWYRPDPPENDCYFDMDEMSYYTDVFTTLTYGRLEGKTVSSELAADEAQYSRYVYQTYLQIPESTKQELLIWASEHGISPDSLTLAEDIQYAIRNAAVYNPKGQPYPEGVDVAVYFLTEAKEGVCQHFATAATLVYRAFGIPARYTVGFVDEVAFGATTDLTSGDAHAWVEIYVDGLGWVPMEVTGSTMADYKPPLHIKAFGATKYYDGQSFENYDLQQYSIVSGTLQPGHCLEVSFETAWYATDPGQYSNRITRCVVYDENGRDVTKEYDITLYDGVMEILKRKLTVTAGSASKIYDGLPLICGDYWISAGSLVPGHEMVVQITGRLVEPGVTSNDIKLEIWGYTPYGSRVERTICYEIEVIPGWLEILPAP